MIKIKEKVFFNIILCSEVAFNVNYYLIFIMINLDSLKISLENENPLKKKLLRIYNYILINQRE